MYRVEFKTYNVDPKDGSTGNIYQDQITAYTNQPIEKIKDEINKILSESRRPDRVCQINSITRIPNVWLMVKDKENDN